jgi:hypothetical protein
MSMSGRRAAVEHGDSLPRFASLEEATAALFSFRDERLAELLRLGASSDQFTPDYTPKSLKGLERWYFALVESDAFDLMDVGQEYFEECMAMYFLETAARNSDAKWTVDEYTFAQGRYQIGVKRPLLAWYKMRISHLPLLKQNKRRESLYREFVKYFGGPATAR